MGVEEKRIHAPREGLGPFIEVIIARNLRKVSIVLCSQMIKVGIVFKFGVVHPSSTSDDGRHANIPAYSPPEVSSFCSVMLFGFLFYKPFLLWDNAFKFGGIKARAGNRAPSGDAN
jgi:hypothetical protein